MDPGQIRSVLKNNFSICVILILFMTLPSLSRTASSILNCVMIAPGVVRLQDDPDVRCWGREHMVYVILAALPSHMLYSIGFPLTGFVLLRRRARQDKLHFETSSDGRGSALFFLHSGYRPERYYWEFVIFARKVALNMVLVLTLDGLLSGLLGLFILQAAFGLHIVKQPFKNAFVNDAESASLLLTSSTLFVGLFFFSDVLSEAPRVFLSVLLSAIVIVAAVVFASLFLYLVSLRRCKKVAKRCTLCQRIVEGGEKKGETQNSGQSTSMEMMHPSRWVTPPVPDM